MLRENLIKFYDKPVDIDVFKQKQKLKPYVKTALQMLEARMKGGGDRRLKILEIGAGTGVFSKEICTRVNGSLLVLSDISIRKVESFDDSDGLARAVDTKNIFLDMDDPQCFEKVKAQFGLFDIILFDAALHHAASLWLTLGFCKTLLAENGCVVASREQFLSKWFYRRDIEKLKAFLRLIL